MGKATTIWKLQRPIATNGSYGDIMAYTEDQSQTAIIPLDEATIHELFGDEYRIYVLGKVKQGNLVIDKVIEDQPW